MLYCKNCTDPCSDLEGDFSCLGFTSKTVNLNDLLARINELFCEDCRPPRIGVDSTCDTNQLKLTLFEKGNAQRVTFEIYKAGVLIKSIRADQTGEYLVNLPFGNYTIKAFDTYNYECTTGVINYSHQCIAQECLAPIVTVNKIMNPPQIVINVLSLGEASTIEVRVLKENNLILTRTLTAIDTIVIPASIGVYSISILGDCPNGSSTNLEYKVEIVDNTCGIDVTSWNYNCTTKKLNLSVVGGSLNYEYSIDGVTWFEDVDLIQFQNETFYNFYVRDAENTTCVYSNVLNTNCNCQISFTATEIQCNQYDCQLSFTYTDVQCNNTLICTINGSIINVQGL